MAYASTNSAGQSVLNYDPTKKVQSPMAGDLTSYYTNLMANHGVTPGMQSKWAQADDSTATAGSQAKMDAASPGMFGQGAASRGLQTTDDSIMKQVAQNKLEQSQQASNAYSTAAEGEQGWQGQQNTQQNADRQFAYNAASDIGDTVTQAGMGKSALGQQGYGYTDYGTGQLQKQATQQQQDADWARQQQQDEWNLTKQQQQQQIDNQNSMWNSPFANFVKPLIGGAAGAATGTLMKNYLSPAQGG